ncbi:MAG: ABC transporter transmembrane domain-containing protein [Pseudonocardia sp.]
MVVLGLLITATYLAQGVLVADALAAVLVEHDFAAVVVPLTVAVVLALLCGGLDRARETLGSVPSERVVLRVRQLLYRRLVRLGPAWVADTRSGAVQATLTTAVEALEKYFRPALTGDLVEQVLGVPAHCGIHPATGQWHVAALVRRSRVS